MKRPNIQLGDKLYWEAKKVADERGLTFSALIEQAIPFFIQFSVPPKPKKVRP